MNKIIASKFNNLLEYFQLYKFQGQKLFTFKDNDRIVRNFFPFNLENAQIGRFHQNYWAHAQQTISGGCLVKFNRSAQSHKLIQKIIGFGCFGYVLVCAFQPTGVSQEDGLHTNLANNFHQNKQTKIIPNSNSDIFVLSRVALLII